ncbi:MAG TPA: YkgJ family cysteine cluster protein [Candidatus Thermoplasmatota archaeon]|nr:YkgJ family cysteine cluster protein [Candidatus Thermoplasmatota archaeon]
MAARFPIEASELRGQTFSCLEGCGFCCLCQPGLSVAERGRFRGPLREAVAPGGDALRIVGQAGPCALLSRERACTQYDLRPRGCRSFPYHTTLSWRAQVNLNRGCPGTWAHGPAAARGFAPAEALPPARETVEALRAAQAAWRAFARQARAASVYEPPARVRARLRACAPLLRTERGLAAGLALAEAGLPVGPRALRAGLGEARVEALHGFLEEQARATFGQQDAKRLPIFVDADDGFRWLAFRLRGDALERLAITPAGALQPRGEQPLAPLPLLARDAGAERLFAAHAGVVVERDLLYGLAAFMLDRLGYGEPFASAALRELCAALGDLWVRAGFLARFDGDVALDGRAMARGVGFFDMDFLNAPTIGVAF